MVNLEKFPREKFSDSVTNLAFLQTIGSLWYLYLRIRAFGTSEFHFRKNCLVLCVTGVLHGLMCGGEGTGLYH